MLIINSWQPPTMAQYITCIYQPAWCVILNSQKGVFCSVMNIVCGFTVHRTPDRQTVKSNGVNYVIAVLGIYRKCDTAICVELTKIQRVKKPTTSTRFGELFCSCLHIQLFVKLDTNICVSKIFCIDVYPHWILEAGIVCYLKWTLFV